jgi:hypothetical protein
MMHKPLGLQDQLRAWLATKSGPYEYNHCRECALAQFLRDAHGADANIRVDTFYYTVNQRLHAIPEPLDVHLAQARTFEELRDLIDRAA